MNKTLGLRIACLSLSSCKMKEAEIILYGKSFLGIRLNKPFLGVYGYGVDWIKRVTWLNISTNLMCVPFINFDNASVRGICHDCKLNGKGE